MERLARIGAQRASGGAMGLLMGIVILAMPVALGAQEEGVPATARQRVDVPNPDLFGIKVIVGGGIQPLVNHVTARNERLSVPIAFSVEVDALYRLPIDEVALDVGIGLRYLINRSIVVEDNALEYASLPLYAVVQLPLTIPSFADFWEIYIDGRIGASFFLPSEAYSGRYLSENSTAGGLFLGIGLGTIFHIDPRFQIRVAAAYSGNNATTTNNVVIMDNVFEVLVGVGVVF